MDQVTGTFRFSGPKLAGMLVGGFLLTIASVLIAAGVIPAGIKGLIAGWVGAPFFGGACIMLVMQLMQADPVVEVTTAAISYHRWPQKFHVPWSEVAGTAIQEMRRRRFLILQLRPQGGYAARRKISMIGLDGSFDDLLNAVKAARAPQRRSA
jgi:hypothetical protein